MESKEPTTPQAPPSPPSQAAKDEFGEVIKRSVAEAKKSTTYFSDVKISSLPTYEETVKAWDDKKRIDFLVDCCEKIHAHSIKHSNYQYSEAKEIRVSYVKHLMKAKLVMDDADVARIYTAFETNKPQHWGGFTYWPITLFINQITNQRKGQEVSSALRATLTQLSAKISDAEIHYSDSERAKLLEKIDALLFVSGGDSPPVRPVLFLGEDALGDYANAMIAQLPEEEKKKWYPLISLAQKASGSKPTTKYLDASKAVFKELGADKFKRIVNDWFEFVIGHKETITEHTHTYNGHTYTSTSTEFLTPVNLEALKGFVWMCSHFHDSQTLRTIAQLAERSFKKIPSKGPAAASLGNACLFVLFKSKGLEGISHLSRLKLRIKQNSTQGLIDKYLEEAARSQGISVAEIEDLAVDDYGLEDGKRIWQYDDYAFELTVTAPGKTQQRWLRPDGTPQKSEPAHVKTNHAAKLKKMKLWIKQVEQATTAQRDRMDRMFRMDRKMKWDYFQAYYLNHGLMSFLTRKIIWRFHQDGTSVDGIWNEGSWVNAQGLPVTPDQRSEVSLWHPATATVAEIKAWRDFLMAKQILQPLKQAFREVYLLTEAEVNTRIYSNRMAAHVLKQHQFNSLAKGRGWKYALLGAYDDGRENEVASLPMPEFGLRVEYWVNEVNADGAFNDTGIWNFIATDQVRFVSTATAQPVPLVDIPPIPFSEAMRDVDLFVGVASVGNDPTWRDSGGVPAYRDYWQSYSFGDLSEVAKMRKEILAGLISRLKIKHVAHIAGNFLVVKGKLRTYKIHIGSSNILMEPNDQYLCIVPDRSLKSNTDNLFLPFEGDGGLSVVLSKAFLLAEDDKITDGTITSQINRA